MDIYVVVSAALFGCVVSRFVLLGRFVTWTQAFPHKWNPFRIFGSMVGDELLQGETWAFFIALAMSGSLVESMVASGSAMLIERLVSAVETRRE